MLSLEEALETTKIHSVAGTLPSGAGIVGQRPFRSPHHTISDAGLVGGGTIPKPGEVSLAHHGVLFLDELPEFRKNVLEVLRQPIEAGHVTISRAKVSVTYPASIMLVAAMNPCPCGYATDPRHECSCTPPAIQRYMSRISGPLMDRIDIHVEVPAVKVEELSRKQDGERSEVIRERVEAARERQRRRFERNRDIFANAHMGSKALRHYCPLPTEGEDLLTTAINRLGLSARAYDRIIKVARTIADIAGSDTIQTPHLAEAIQYRSLDRQLWLG
jgi:magnesium chelatase family protein